MADILLGIFSDRLSSMKMFGFRLKFHCSMMTSSNGNIFRVTGHLCGEFTGPRWIPRTKASDAELWCFLWSAPYSNKWLSKQWWCWLFETPSSPLWRLCNGLFVRCYWQWLSIHSGKGFVTLNQWWHNSLVHMQGWFQVCAQPMRDVVTK